MLPLRAASAAVCLVPARAASRHPSNCAGAVSELRIVSDNLIWFKNKYSAGVLEVRTSTPTRLAVWLQGGCPRAKTRHKTGHTKQRAAGARGRRGVAALLLSKNHSLVWRQFSISHCSRLRSLPSVPTHHATTCAVLARAAL